MINYIKTEYFRNLAADKIPLQAKNIVLYGDNGQGKTNFLEAIYYLIFANSFRGVKEEMLCSTDTDNFVLFGKFSHLEHFDEDKLGVSWAKSGKHIVLNGSEVHDRKALVRNFPCIVFSYNDLQLVDGNMETRRRFFDQIISLIQPDYIDSLRRYKKILKHRNFLLRTQNLRALPIFTEQLVDVGLDIMRHREHITQLFAKIFLPMIQCSADLQLECLYQPHWHTTNKDELLKMFHVKHDTEIAQGMTLYGPHRDRYQFLILGHEVSQYLSLGQKRLLALCLKSSACVLFCEQSHRLPILLLDDIFLELTHAAREQFLANIPTYEQAFFTLLPQEIGTFQLESSLIYFVKNGRLDTQ